MRHRAKTVHFGRKSGPRKALIRGLVISLVKHGRIKTTLAKAKELRRHVEPAITMAKKQTLHAQRLLVSRFHNQEAITTLMKEVAPRFKDREGGYTRILKIGSRPGDNAEVAYIEFVDYTAPVVDETVKADAEKKQKKVTAKNLAAKKTKARKQQETARRVLRDHLA